MKQIFYILFLPFVFIYHTSSGQGLEFSNCINLSSYSIVTGSNLTVSMTLKNTGTSTWNGGILVTISEIGNSSNNLPIYTLLNTSISAGNIFSINPTASINLATGNYRVIVRYTNAPTGGADVVSAGNCSPTGTAANTGTIYHYEDLVITAPAPPELEFSQCFTTSSSNVTTGGQFNVSYEVKNIGSSSWTGTIYTGIGEVNNSTNTQPLKITTTTIGAGSTKIINTGQVTISVIPGNYRVAAVYTDNGSNTPVRAGNCTHTKVTNGITTHYEDLVITAPTPPVLEFSQCFTTSSPTIASGGQFNAAYEVRNIGSSTWTGTLYTLLGEYGNLNNRQFIDTAANISIAAGALHTINTGNDVISLPNGNYRVVTLYTNTGGNVSVTAGNCTPTDVNNGITTHYEDLVITAPTPAQLEFDQCINAPSALNQGSSFNATFSVKNVGATSWHGKIYTLIRDSNTDTTVQVIDTVMTTIPEGSTQSINTGSNVINLNIGNYKVVPISYELAAGNATDVIGYGGCSPSSIANSGTTYHYHDLAVIANTCGNTVFTDLDPNVYPTQYAAAICLCQRGAVNGQNWGINNANGIKPFDKIIREDLAQVMFTVLYGSSLAPSPADSFPVPFNDLNNNWVSYYKYAKALSYLEYGDGISVFTRDAYNFRSGDFIKRKFAVKALLEAFNIAPDNTQNQTFINAYSDVYGASDEMYGYLNKAYQMNIMIGTNGLLRPDDDLFFNQVIILLKI